MKRRNLIHTLQPGKKQSCHTVGFETGNKRGVL